LAELLAAVSEHRGLSHLVHVLPILARSLLAFDEEIDPDRFPVGADEVEHQGNSVGVAGLGEAVELIFWHVSVPVLFRPTPY
jgi:hypothetical protein